MRNETVKHPILQFDFNQQTTIFSQPIQVIQTSNLSEVKQCLQQIEIAIQSGYYVAGYLSYEVTYAFLHRQMTPKASNLPLLWFGVFKAPDKEMTSISTEQPYHVGKWKVMQTKQEYEQAFAHIMKKIQDGDIDQVNYTVPFKAHFSGNTYRYYERLKTAQNARYSAYLQLGNMDILSASPELFFQVDGNDITVKPMKGTIHRGKSYDEDMAHRAWLQSSKKNQLENKLIIDLMKEELHPITNPASIHIPALYEVEQYPTVYQMTSTIKGQLQSTITFQDMIERLFPCGSISGVPKKETIALIHELEPFARDVYCGAIGYMTPNREAIFNVPIRTVTIDHEKEQATYGAGGAITANSSVEEEYEEMLTKTKVLTLEEPTFELLETIGLLDGKLIVLEEHLIRLKRSAAYFQYNVEIDNVRKKLLQVAEQYNEEAWRVRLTVAKRGNIDIVCQPMQHMKQARVALAKKPIDRENHFHYHKTTNRVIYDQHKVEDPHIFDVLLWNERNELTEFTIGNLVVELDGMLYTPPIHSGVLPGTFRESLLKSGKIQEKVMHTSELVNATRIWLINSVRQWVDVHFDALD